MYRFVSFTITMVCALALLSGGAFATDYYVATNGGDTNAGTLALPFATIQHAVDVMEPGDTCYIRGGSYHEEVDLSGVAGSSGKPVTFTNYNDEAVTLDGTYPIASNWTQHSGNIYKTTLSEDIWQLFVDGKMMTLARFPNALTFSDKMWHRTDARRVKDTVLSKRGYVVDDPTLGATATLAGAGVSFDDCIAVMNFGNFATSARIVSNHTAGTNNFHYSPKVVAYKPKSPRYFFEGGIDDAELVMLDMAQEWAYDESTNTLYLWADNGQDPNGRAIAGKNQTYFFEGDASTQHITIDGLDFFATTFKFVSSDHITIQNCDLDYFSYSKRALGSLVRSEPAFIVGTTENNCYGITVTNCEFNYSSGTGLLGEYIDGGSFENNLFYQNSYATVTDSSGQTPATVKLQLCNGTTFRRNTIDTSGSGQAVKLDKLDDRPWISEYNYFTACGLQQTDGSAHYSYKSGPTESVSRYNWFYGNSARDFRWDGKNTPEVTGIRANLYRTVAMDTGRKEGRIDGDGYRLKGDSHEIYNNIGIGDRSTINVALDKGGNPNTVTRNNAADNFTDDPIPGTDSNNFVGQYEPKNLKDLLRDPDNMDFRPRADAVELIDQGTPVTCSVNGSNIDVTAGYNGAAPDIGAYEYGDTNYWIPGRIVPQASMPVPPSGNQNVKLDADLMWLGGKDATSYNVYFGTEPGKLTLQGKQTSNIFSPGPLAPDTVYYWRIDSVGSGGTVTGDVWIADTTFVASSSSPSPPPGQVKMAVTSTAPVSFTNPFSFTAAEDTRCWETGSKNSGTENPLWIQNNQTRRMYAKFHVSGVGSVRSAILRLAVANGPIPDIDVYAVTGEWDEMTLTGANDDLVWGSLLDTRTNCDAGSAYDFDVSSVITGDGTHTFGIKTDADLPGLKISSRESVTGAPTLFVDPVSLKKQEELDIAYEHVGVAVEQKGTHVWGTSPVIGKDGKVHLFVAQWPIPEDKKERFNGYFKTSEIAQYVGDSPEGPFEFLRMVVRDQNGTFNAPHNPTIQFIDGQYVLCFIVNSNDDRGKQRIIMYVADDPNGEWRPAKGAEPDGTILRRPEGTSIWCHNAVRGVSNPALIKHNGEYRIYFKGAIPDPEKEPGFYNREFGYGVATSKNLEGPYEFYPERLTSDEIELEDVYAFSYDERIYMMSRDIAASLGSKEGGLLWESKDGIHFPKEKTRRAFESLATYLDEGALDGAAKYRGTEQGQLERPQILLIDGEPAYLYLATGINPQTGFGSCSHVFKLNIKQK